MITSGGTATLGLYDNISEIRKKADITYVDAKASDLQQNINSLAGGHVGYATLAKANAATSTLAPNTLVEVTNDTTTANNGLYLWNGTALTKSDYDPLTQAKHYADEVNAQLREYEEIQLPSGKNLFNLKKIQSGKYVNTQGILLSSSNTGWATSEYIPVIPSQTYTLSGTFGYTGVGFFANNTAKTAISHTQNLTLPYTFTVPAGATHIVFNIAQPSRPNFSNVQLENGSSATSYEDGFERRLIKSSEVDGLSALIENAKEEILNDVNLEKEYEIVIPASSKNLFNEKTQIVLNRYLNATSGLLSISANNWATSEYIPVIPSQTYTLSGTFGYTGVGFFANNTAKTPVSYLASPSYPLTFTVPENATHLIFNIFQPTKPNYANIQLELGPHATKYEAGYELKKINGDFVDFASSQVDAVAIAKLKDNDLIIVTNNVEMQNLLRKQYDFVTPTVFNFNSVFIDGVRISNATDDVPPIYIKGQEIGGNHGYVGAVIRSINHGKTVEDIGSLWSSEGEDECIILDVINTETIVVTKTQNNTEFPTSEMIFTHKSGAQHTAEIVANSVSSVQIKSVVNRHKQSLSADGITVNNNGLYKFRDNFTVSESYGLITKSDLVSHTITNAGAKIASYDDVEPFVRINHVYRFDTEGGCTISTNVVVLEQSSFSKMMLVQAARILGDNLMYYIPKILPFNVGAINYDFAKGVDISGAQKPTSNILLAGSYVDQEKGVPDRYIQTTNIGNMANGVLPVLDGKKADRLINTTRSFGLVSTALKQYHHFIDSADISDLAAGTCFAGKGYRKYFKNTDVDKISAYAIYDSDVDYYVVDYKHNVAKIDVVDLPARLHAREFEIIDKSENIAVLSKVATSQIHLSISNSAECGYLMLKFIG